MNHRASTILELFRGAGDFVSGERISREFGISRSAVWKHISALRRHGYQVEAVPSRGYRLIAIPDVLSADSIEPFLTTERMARRTVSADRTVSTNADAFRLADLGAPEGTLVVADCQSGGKGRRGRVWTSPPGVNLYCSLVLRPQIMPWEAPRLTFLSAVAVARAIELTCGLTPSIKWPNDVLVDGCKVAGLLNEMNAETDAVAFVILGIGVNLNMTADQFPADLRHPATSLMLAGGRTVNRPLFAATMINEFERLYLDYLSQGFASVKAEWELRCNAAGRHVSVSDGDAELARGEFAGIDDDGAMLVRRQDGGIERIISGDVRVC